MNYDVMTWYFYRPDALTVWENQEVRKRLNWYLRVMKNKKPAKYLICKRIKSEVKLNEASLKELWDEHERLSLEFKKIWEKIRNNYMRLDSLKKVEQSFLDVKIALAYRILENCHFCERRCGKNRLKGERGFCKLDKDTYVSSYFLHTGEEAPLVPSGTIFFCGCNSACVFCQNYSISQEWITENGVVVDGFKATPPLLAIIMEELHKRGALNINLVGGDPIPNLHTVLKALSFTNINSPILWNSNFYMSIEATRLLIEVIDIGLPDFKYGSNKCALRLSKLPNYFEVVSRNVKMFHDEGINSIVRHLVLPNHLECCTKPILEWLSKNCPTFMVNIMEQYRMEYLVARYPEKYPDVARRPSRKEMNEAYAYADKLKLVWRPVS